MCSDRTKAQAGARAVRTRRGLTCRLPLFLPVYQTHNAIVPIEDLPRQYAVEGCIVNAYFLYKNRQIRERFEAGLDLHDYIGLDGLVMTDSGAFQGFTRPLLLKNKTIVAFQDGIGADVVSPLDIVTPPGDSRSVADRKLHKTLQRVREAKALVKQGVLAGVQQGGRFPDLRRRGVEELMAIGVEYLAIGSLVPFFTRNHNLRFVGAVLRDARAAAGPDIPIHVYGAGDPLELPFMVALGADVFDSSSYAHFAKGGWYMTPFGAIREPGPLLAGEYVCECHVCAGASGPQEVFADAGKLAAHNLWTITDTIRRVREALAAGSLDRLIGEILDRHAAWRPQSDLKASWESLHG